MKQAERLRKDWQLLMTVKLNDKITDDTVVAPLDSDSYKSNDTTTSTF